MLICFRCSLPSLYSMLENGCCCEVEFRALLYELVFLIDLSSLIIVSTSNYSLLGTKNTDFVDWNRFCIKRCHKSISLVSKLWKSLSLSKKLLNLSARTYDDVNLVSNIYLNTSRFQNISHLTSVIEPIKYHKVPINKPNLQ